MVSHHRSTEHDIRRINSSPEAGTLQHLRGTLLFKPVGKSGLHLIIRKISAHLWLIEEAHFEGDYLIVAKAQIDHVTHSSISVRSHYELATWQQLTRKKGYGWTKVVWTWVDIIIGGSHKNHLRNLKVISIVKRRPIGSEKRLPLINLCNCISLGWQFAMACDVIAIW